MISYNLISVQNKRGVGSVGVAFDPLGGSGGLLGGPFGFLDAALRGPVVQGSVVPPG